LQEGAAQRSISHAQRLYDWLVRPLEPDLTALKIATLVYVPDGALRTIPMAALHDGAQFLISKYALATTPGLDLTDPRPIPREHLQVLDVGVDAPVQGFAPLPHVSLELQAIQHLYGGTLLLNQDFRLSTLEKVLRRAAFSIVHVASHGQFAGDVKQSFILTFDGKLTIDRLEQFVGRLRFRDAPLELLTLRPAKPQWVMTAPPWGWPVWRSRPVRRVRWAPSGRCRMKQPQSWWQSFTASCKIRRSPKRRPSNGRS
jgi:CHAT domain-containing protein